MERYVVAGHHKVSSGPADGRLGLLTGLIVAGIALSACSTADRGETPGGAAILPGGTGSVVVTSEQLVGRWGLGSFRNEADLARTTEEARRFCNNPYTITAGPNGGVMMYLADQAQPTELFVKASGGRVYIGPPGPAGVMKDRQVTSFQDGVMVAAWVDPTVAARYGTMVFAKCPETTAARATGTTAPVQ